ncbi:MAG: 30S ribosomal protein S2 [Candidatus Nealsonbacteria bacterium CG_4_10_14_0_8_um_filter_35_10]|uniref:Small ribosomal subunit protein uS2 n=2 Tax=Candidatus Nealsoniibacteriota TaxID=1817911 RepID=A0A2M7R894_9BACT|nr:MAG: 30S ribosomal protein S2 [Parcubacteria group bacterium CG1_02_36_42]PIY90798.1 MAG: 30S ribosomal protein S2 [Candidatus Nealsonbacteria bacterium CG_4_10_14_0_8_um_filter_35_10]PJB99731.1 MAG: 30S ribosomal protein S2 [Candidatus Nealsonbacteria bacterium CG_4_9_14_0_8_um_filter_35_12]
MAETKEKIKESDFGINLEEMARAGLHFGHRTSKCHPKMKPFLAGVKNTIHIIDLEKTAQKLKEALKFIQEFISENKILLIVGTKIQIKDLVKEVATELNLPYVNERWLGGTFTNFEVIKKRIDYFKDLEKKRIEGAFEKYTKKEKAQIDQEIKDLEIKFGGLKNLERLPDAIFVLDMRKDETAIREAKRKGIKIIGIAHTNVDPTLADYPIPASDDAISSVKYILEKVKEVILKAKQRTENKEQKSKNKEQ